MKRVLLTKKQLRNNMNTENIKKKARKITHKHAKADCSKKLKTVGRKAGRITHREKFQTLLGNTERRA